MMKIASCYLGISLAALVATSAHAQTFSETTDAGVTESTAALLPPKINRVTGTLKPGTGGPFDANPVDVDVFAFTILESTSIDIVARSDDFDMNLLLLREGFFGIYGDDDGLPGANGYDSRIPATGEPALILPKGTYYIAIGRNNIGAYPFGATMAGQDVWNNDSGLLPPALAAIPIAFIGDESAGPTASTGEPYVVTFNFKTSVTGLDLSAGKNRKSLRGIDVLNKNGKRQTAAISGGGSAKFLLQLTNTGGKRKVQAGLVKASRKLPVNVREVGKGGRNVTASMKTGRYRKNLASGAAQRFQVTVQGTPGTRSRVLFEARDTKRKSMRDCAGARVKFS